MARPQPLFLIHERTKQRYPLRGDFVIGRSTGDLVFDQDPKLSGKHCLIRSTEGGSAIYDLKSRTGILINGIPLPNGKACVLKAGVRVTLGDQSFAINEDKRAVSKGEIAGSGDQRAALLAIAPLILVVMIAAAYIWPPHAHSSKPTEVRVAAKTNTSNELTDLIRKFDAMGLVHGRSLTPPQMFVLREKAIPQFEALHNQLQAAGDVVGSPSNNPGANAREFDRRLSGAYLGLLNAIAARSDLTENQSPGEIEQFEREIKSLRAGVKPK